VRCFIRQVGGNWHASFDYAGKSYTHSLRTKDEGEAEVRLGPIRDTLYRLGTGTLSMPAECDPKAFIVSGGLAPEKPRPTPRVTVGDIVGMFLESRQGIEENTRATVATHLGHFSRILKADTPLGSISLPEIDAYAAARLKEKRHGKPTRPRTIQAELRTVKQAMKWAADRGHIKTSPTWTLKSVSLPKDSGRERFRTYAEIELILRRGKAKAPARLWETLYLTGAEVEEVLDYVQEKATVPWIYPMVAFVALTGCRRSEMLRSLVEDWDLEAGHVSIREKKRDTSKEFTMREVDIHPRLREVMAGWLKSHPGGQHVITWNGKPSTRNGVTKALRRTLAGHSKWSKVRGFHTFRHSVASILASKGVDQRYIDKIIGHQTEAMRKRYQYLFPKGVAQAINSLLG
jgi:integrase